MGLEKAKAEAMPRPVLGLCKILPDGELPEGNVRLSKVGFNIETCPDMPRAMLSIVSGANMVFAHLDRGVIRCPACGNSTFRASIRSGEAVLSCSGCGLELEAGK
jgi:hypothetical protein